MCYIKNIKKMYYNKKGELIELMEWAKLREDENYKIVKQETLPNGKWVSTVWLGLDHSFSERKPLIFETMVFSSEKGNSSEKMERYSTLEEAEKGHQEMVEKFNRV